MAKRIYYRDAKCSYKIASDILYMSERSGARYLHQMYKELGCKRVSVGMFSKFYGVDNVELL